MNKVAWLVSIFAIYCLYVVFGATTSISISSATAISNIVHNVLSETNFNAGSSNLNASLLIKFYSGVSNNGVVLGKVHFYGRDSNSVSKSYVEITASKQTGSTTNGAASLGFAVRGTNGTILTSMLLDEFGAVSVNKLSLLNLVLSGDGSILALPTTIGATNAGLAIGTNGLYWRAIP